MNGENYGKRRRSIAVLFTLVAVVVAAVFLTLKWCGGGMDDEERHLRDSTLVSRIQTHSRLFTAEVTARKTVTYTTENKLTVSLLGRERTMRIPFGKTTATIPVNVTYKAYIDLEKVTRDNIIIDDRNSMIHITLPDPVLVETAVGVDHENEKMDKEWFGKKLTYEEYRQLLRDAKEQAWRDITEEELREISEMAKVTVGEMVIPHLHTLGFENIIIEYRPSFVVTDMAREQKRD